MDKVNHANGTSRKWRDSMHGCGNFRMRTSSSVLLPDRKPGISLGAFSLIELLTVIAILGILSTLLVPAISSISRGSNLNRAGQMIADELALARQEAVTKNRDVEVRFYELTNGLSPGWRAVRRWRVDQTPTGPVTNASSRLIVIPEGIVMATKNDLSPLVTSNTVTGTETHPSYGSVKYSSFRFRGNGSLKTSVDTNTYVTLVNAPDSEARPANFYTLQINPLTGKVSIFRP